MRLPRLLVRAVALVATLAVAQVASALANRTFVASRGIDTGSCSATSPCRSFGFALAQTNPGGEIVAIDSAGFGSVVIDRSVTLVAPPGVYAGVSVSSGIGITIAVGSFDRVVLRGLVVNGVGGSTGILVTQAFQVQIERCLITGFNAGGNIGVQVAPTTTTKVFVSDSTVRGNFVGISADGAAAPASRLEVARTRVQNSVLGIVLNNFSRASVVDSLIGHNDDGIAISVDASSPANANVAIDRATISDNTGRGIVAQGANPLRSVIDVSNSTIAGNSHGITALAGGFVRVMSSQIDGNTTALQTVGNGFVETLLNNMCYGNGSACAFSGNIPLN